MLWKGKGGKESSCLNSCRRDGSYIIEEFLTTGGTDVKVYTVGPRYAHAEARKSPVVDGKVMRAADGKEIRYPVLLSPQVLNYSSCMNDCSCLLLLQFQAAFTAHSLPYYGLTKSTSNHEWLS